MASLQDLLEEEGFRHGKVGKCSRSGKVRDRTAPEESAALPIYVCYDRRSSKQKVEKYGSSVFSSKKMGSISNLSKSKSLAQEGLSRGEEPAIDEVAIKAVISILSGYIGRYGKDENFREMIREKCSCSCLARREKDSDNGIFENLEIAMQNIDKLLEKKETKKELRVKSLRNSIQLLSIVASLNSKKSRNGSTCGVPNSHLSACAQLYLSIVYKLEKNERISARHLLQVFCDSPRLARTHILPDLWEHFFLPHLLHLKVWYHNELESLHNLSDSIEKEKQMKALGKVYDDQIDTGTIKFAMYYEEWLKVGAQSPAVPFVPLPSRPSYRSSRRNSSDSYASRTSINKNLYKAVFGPTVERHSMDLHSQNRESTEAWNLKEEEIFFRDLDKYKLCNYVHNKTRTPRRSSSQNSGYQRTELRPETQRRETARFFKCQTVRIQSPIDRNYVARYNLTGKEENSHIPFSDLSRASTTISSSDSLNECEIAIRVMTKAWLYSRGDPAVEVELRKAPVIEGMLEVIFASDDEEVLELAISILAELVSRNEVRQIILNLDPQLEIFLRLLKSSSLFLKAAVMLYLLKPKAKQMISAEWIPVVLRVLEFGDQSQTLFTVRCCPRVAAFYFLDQLLTGFNEDRNLENARELVSLGGLGLLLRGIEIGNVCEKNIAALIISCCIRSDGSCRNYVAKNLNKASLLELIAVRNQQNDSEYAFALLADILCLDRRTHRASFLNDLQNGEGGLNALHVLLIYLQRAPLEERPLVAAILLQLDLLGDPLRNSVYREEAVEAIIESLHCKECSDNVQEQSARALMMLGGRFSCTGEATTEKWLLQQAGFDDDLSDSFQNEKVVDHFLDREEEAIREWQSKAAVALLNSGNKRFLAALSNCIANGTPNLTQACLSTVAWMSKFLPSIGDKNFQFMACSILVPQLKESSSYDRSPEERVLASFSLQQLLAISECASVISSFEENLINHHRNTQSPGGISSWFNHKSRPKASDVWS